eukprot:GFUD01026090.1.p1 GENE.GFUD01026090.1~~GFUD01026090.1.p1  ORF type:complete len:259 (+),score=89.17 GFUD01026090.1:223-999(+)
MKNFKQFLCFKEFVAEFIGTFILVVIAKSSSLNLTALQADGAVSTLLGSLAAGLGVMTGIIVTGGASGGHINPAVSVAMTACKKLPISKLPAYLLGQYLGAGVGAALVLFLYSGQHGLALASYPGLVVDPLPLVVDQLTATFLLVLGIAAVVEQNLQPGGLLVGLIVVGIGLALGPNAGAAMNPAVDFMPRLLSALWSSSVPFYKGDNFFWLVPLIVPHFGGLLAVFTYKFGIVGLRQKIEEKGKVEENGKVEEEEML